MASLNKLIYYRSGALLGQALAKIGNRNVWRHSMAAVGFGVNEQ
jgi:hypothetical protein